MLPYWRFADRFGWTPSQVRRESHLEMWAIARIDDVAEDLRAKAKQRSGQGQQQILETLGG
jgi:hypothetical protein